MSKATPEERVRRRRAADRRFRVYCVAAVAVALGFLVLLFGNILLKGFSAFQQTFIRLDVELDALVIDPAGTRDPKALSGANYSALVRRSLQDLVPGVEDRGARRELGALVSLGAAYQIQSLVEADPSLIGSTQSLWVPASDDVDMLIKGYIRADAPQSERSLSDRQLSWVDTLRRDERIERRFNRAFFLNGDSREPELAGILGATLGSLFTMAVTLLLSFPLGVATAIYLEEFAPRNRWTDIIEVNINNLAAVPSIVFGLLGLAVFLNIFGLPRSAPLVGGLVLSLLTLPTIIIASRVALSSVPPSIREAAYGLGATPLQVISHHVLPTAMPGILTGSIIGMARALGETAPLLMIGMVAFIVDLPRGLMAPATVLPVQVYLWADSPERAFVERTSAAILCLLAFLIVMNAAAVWLRRRSERR